MSCNYADGLSHYENKGVLGVEEIFDTDEILSEKCVKLVEWLQASKHVVVHTGAGISTSAGIPDFRGPKGVWTLEAKGETPAADVSFNEAKPTLTHMALCALVKKGYIHYIVSQNIDGLHLKSGLSRKYIAELHGNIFIEQCKKCNRQFVRATPSETIGQKTSGIPCYAGKNSKGEISTRSCRGGTLHDNVLDWEHDLPERDLDMAVKHSTLADLNITLGTTLQIYPSGVLPLKNLKHNGRLIICNLQPTKYDKKANLTIHTYVDVLLAKVCELLNIDIPMYSHSDDPTKSAVGMDWSIQMKEVQLVSKLYNNLIKQAANQRKLKSNNQISKKSSSKKKRKL